MTLDFSQIDINQAFPEEEISFILDNLATADEDSDSPFPIFPPGADAFQHQALGWTPMESEPFNNYSAFDFNNGFSLDTPPNTVAWGHSATSPSTRT
ncbi:hypothetical protein FALBO_16681 [Fusarium albosuccineum]|uniref:Uncharacterized protein n=1 Tax=Fusarium albosuccineum TaxID=1237068 RepID=A0A8H4KDK5_9HYPO|nr:hypothetical protein FALBO_16681 [Fusarium albosuccineum]